MKITYLYHSGFMVEFDKVSIVIDYFSFGLGPLPSALERALADSSRRLYVLASHNHADHFDSRILSFERTHRNVTYVLCTDIAKEAARLGTPKSVQYINVGESFKDGNIGVQAFGSTDEGLSFLINADGKSIFHAGDLNNWHWNEECTPEESATFEANYLAELEKLAAHTQALDVAMFPVDPRLGKDYMRGAEQFVARIKTKCFIPMHFGEKYNDANAFKPIAEKYGTKFFEISDKGQPIKMED